jgi:hypothetical protein
MRGSIFLKSILEILASRICAPDKILIFIIFSDLDLAYIDLSYMCCSRNHDTDYLSYIPSIKNEYIVPIHIIIFSSYFDFYVLHWPWLQGTKFCARHSAWQWTFVPSCLKTPLHRHCSYTMTNIYTKWIEIRLCIKSFTKDKHFNDLLVLHWPLT